MAENFTETSHRSYGSRLGGSFKGMARAIVIFLLGFPILFWNEGRAVKRAKAIETGEKEVVPVLADTIAPENEGKLIHFSGKAVAGAILNDDIFRVSVTNALRLTRKVEMYQWTEESDSETKVKLGGSEDTTTSYSYKKCWNESLIDSTKFEHPNEHENPQTMPYQSETWYANGVSVGAFAIPDNLTRTIGSEIPMKFAPAVEALVAPAETNAPLSYLPPNTTQTATGFTIKAGTNNIPEIGDMRISFEYAPETDVSFVAKQVGSTIAAYPTKTGTILLEKSGIHSAEEMFQDAKVSNKFVTWILRFIGFFLMYAGLKSLIEPLRVLADVLPFLGSIVGAGIGLIAGIVALILSAITIAIAWFFYRPIVAIILIIVAVLASMFLVQKLHSKKAVE